MAALPELMHRARSWRYTVTWARAWTPILLDERGESFVQECWTKVATRERRHLTTDALAYLLAVADDEPSRFNLRCIPAMSRTAEERTVDRKRSKAEIEAKRRAANPNHTPRSESAAATKPWEAAGISRRTWYSRRAAERLAAGAVQVDEAPLHQFVDTVSVSPELHCFVDTVSVAPGCTVSWTSDPLLPLSSGMGGPGQDVAANDNPAGEAPPLTETGYRGRYLILTPAEVQHTLRRFPNLAAGLGAHLDAIDAEMQKPKSRTPLARQNLIRYRARRVARDLRKAA